MIESISGLVGSVLPVLVHALFGVWLEATPASGEIYSAVLTEVGSLAPERKIVLTTTLSRPECSPHCEGNSPVASHSADLVEALKARGLILSSCTPTRGSVSCGSGRDVWAADRMTVTLGPIEQTERGQVVVSATVHWRFEYRGRGLSSLQGYRYSLACDGKGKWKVVASTLTWTA